MFVFNPPVRDKGTILYIRSGIYVCDTCKYTWKLVLFLTTRVTGISRVSCRTTVGCVMQYYGNLIFLFLFFSYKYVQNDIMPFEISFQNSRATSNKPISASIVYRLLVGKIEKKNIFYKVLILPSAVINLRCRLKCGTFDHVIIY